jgi:predicted AAA+ superfamily ATPase
MIKRRIQKQIEQSLKNKKSILLLGPRQTGKSTLISGMNPDLEFNLIHQPTFLEFVKNPHFLEQSLKANLPKGGTVFVDEVQRVPSILNTIQYLIDKKSGYQFILTGSSARKLKKGNANLLPGRLHAYDLGPIISSELSHEANTDLMLSYGSLPGVITQTQTSEIKKLLKSYTTTYLNEEIKAEALTKNLEGFTRFLFNLAADATQFLDLTKVSKLVGVPRQTTQRFFEILEDTLIVQRIDAFAKSEKRRLIQHPRFYIFDNGVLNALLNNFKCSIDRKGRLFENLFVTQLSASLKASNLDYRLSSYRTDAGAEVDIILEIENTIHAIEIKTGAFNNADFSGLKSFKKFIGKNVQLHVAIPEGSARKVDDIQIIPWQKLLETFGI